ncbi:unnamed protein product [Absidia cylindrospora]
METTASSPSERQRDINETEENRLQEILQHSNHTSISLSSAPALLSEPARRSTDDSSIIQFPAKSISRSPRTRSLAHLLSNDEEKALPSTSLPSQDSLLNHFSAPSRISRSSTHQHLFTPELDYDGYSSTAALTSDFDEKNKRKKRQSAKDLAKMVPSKRGVGNIMTIFAVIAVIIFLFAGYPLTIYLTRRFHSSS